MAALLCSGCLGSGHTRLPTLAYAPPDVARRSFEFHDPEPDVDFGPNIERPRGFERQRAVPRRSLERWLNRSGAGASTGLAPSAERYPNSVTP